MEARVPLNGPMQPPRTEAVQPASSLPARCPWAGLGRGLKKRGRGLCPEPLLGVHSAHSEPLQWVQFDETEPAGEEGREPPFMWMSLRYLGEHGRA